MDEKITTQEKVAYLAGLIDGEGYMGINKANKGKWNLVNNYKVRLSITGTKTSLINWIVENFGGAYYSRKRESCKHSVCYTWTVGCDFAGRIIEMVYPYLVIKKRQAEIIIAYRKIQKLNIPTCPGTKAIPEELRQEIMDTIKLLNRRGSESVETNMPDISNLLMKIESELDRNTEKRVSDNLLVKRNQFSFSLQ